MVDLFFSWYFLEVPKQIKKVWVNYLWFFEKYFAIGELVGDFIAPYKGLHFERETVGFDLGEMAYVAFSNVFSRFIGCLMRSIALVIGLIVMLFVVAAGIAAFVAWALFLFALVYSVFKGFQVLFV